MSRTNVLAVAGSGSKYSVSGGEPAGFWAGVWHGLISPLTFLISLFDSDVRIYETHNRGRLYDLGFMVGVAATFGSSGSQTAVWRVYP